MQTNCPTEIVTHPQPKGKKRGHKYVGGTSFVRRLVTSVAPGKPLNEEDFSQEPGIPQIPPVWCQSWGDGAAEASGPAAAFTAHAEAATFELQSRKTIDFSLDVYFLSVYLWSQL